MVSEILLTCVVFAFRLRPPGKPGQTGKGPLSEARNSLVKLKVKVGRVAGKGSTWAQVNFSAGGCPGEQV